MQPVARRAQSPTQEVTCPQTPDRFRASPPVRESALVLTTSTRLTSENSGESVWTHCRNTRRIRTLPTREPLSHFPQPVSFSFYRISGVTNQPLTTIASTTYFRQTLHMS